MHRANRYPRDSHTREHVSPHLEHPHGQCTFYNRLGRHADLRKSHCRTHEQNAIERHEPELNEGQRNGVPELGQDCFSCVGRECTGGVPEGAEKYEASGLYTW